MATTHHTGQYHETRFDEDKYPVFKNAFSDKTRHDLIDDDITAGKNVLGVLVTLVVTGLIIGVIGLIFGVGY